MWSFKHTSWLIPVIRFGNHFSQSWKCISIWEHNGRPRVLFWPLCLDYSSSKHLSAFFVARFKYLKISFFSKISRSGEEGSQCISSVNNASCWKKQAPNLSGLKKKPTKQAHLFSCCSAFWVSWDGELHHIFIQIFTILCLGPWVISIDSSLFSWKGVVYVPDVEVTHITYIHILLVSPLVTSDYKGRGARKCGPCVH